MDRVECESPPRTETSFSVRGLRVSVLWSGGSLQRPYMKEMVHSALNL